MQSESSILFWVIVVLPSIFGLFIFLVQYRELSRLKTREKATDQLLQSNENLIAAYESARQQWPKPEVFSSGQAALLPEEVVTEAGFLLMKFDSKGNLLQSNRRVKEQLGLLLDESKPINYSGLCSPRNQRIILSELRRQRRGGQVQLIPFRIVNRYGEGIQLDIRLINMQESGEVFFMGEVKNHQPGFGMLRMGPVMESLLFRSRWPSILLERQGRYGGWRISRIAWLSASSARLFGTDVLKAIGLPLEVVSSGLSSLISDSGTADFSGRIWDNPANKDESYRIQASTDADYCLLLLQRINGREAADILPETPALERNVGIADGVSFAQLQEIINGDEEFLKILIPGYLTTIRECRREFRLALQISSPERIKFLHHKVKATIRTFAFTKMDDIFFLAIDCAAAEPGPETEMQKNSCIARLNEACSELEQAITDFGKNRNVVLK